MLDRIAELIIFGFTPLLVGLLVAPGLPEAASGFYGRDWQVDQLDGISALPERRATFRIEDDGKIGGKGFCNGYFASARIDGDGIEIGRAGATQMACAPELMAADAALFDAFEKAANIHADGENLVIADKDGREIVRFIPL